VKDILGLAPLIFPNKQISQMEIIKILASSLMLSFYSLILGIHELKKPTQEAQFSKKRKIIPLLIVLSFTIPLAYAYVHEQKLHDLVQTILDVHLMEEDFDDLPPGTDPPGWDETSGNWTTVDDGGNMVYYQDDDADQEALSISTTGNVSWANYTYTVDVKFVEGNTKKDDRGALLLFHYNGGNDYYFLWMKEHTDELSLHNHGGWGGGNTVANSSCTMVQDNWYHVSITIIGQLVNVSIDGTLYFYNVDMNGPENSGSVAIGTRYYKCMFDNIYVEEIQ
jgi:hypothetical protein